MPNMLHPSKVANAVIDKLNANLATLIYNNKGITKAVKVSTVPKSSDVKGIKPPWAGVFYSLLGKAGINEAGTIDDLPVTIGILLSSSSGYEDDSDALDEVINYALLLEDLIPGEYVINLGTVDLPDERLIYLRMKEEPFEVLVVDPDMTLATISFQYPYQK